ncbi:hypothetical protein BJV77DRAFT_1125488 [Russula vinacea]|nr:hypothetical protein BJV77DRAFT_1125488 [Russula vinacea]
MVNYDDPVTTSARVAKLWHIVNGIFIWEFITNLDYEWDVILGHRPYYGRYGFVYSLARVSTLLAVILNMVNFDTTTPINCQAWVISEIFQWEYGCKISYSSSVLRSTWSPEAVTCVVANIDSTNLLLSAHSFPTAGYFSSCSLGCSPCAAGLIWLLLATIAEVPPTVLMILNMNVPLNLFKRDSSGKWARTVRDVASLCAHPAQPGAGGSAYGIRPVSDVTDDSSRFVLQYSFTGALQAARKKRRFSDAGSCPSSGCVGARQQSEAQFGKKIICEAGARVNVNV